MCNGFKLDVFGSFQTQNWIVWVGLKSVKQTLVSTKQLNQNCLKSGSSSVPSILYVKTKPSQDLVVVESTCVILAQAQVSDLRVKNS